MSRPQRVLYALSHVILFGYILHEYNTIERPQPLPQLHVHLALHVHEHKSSREADRDYNKFSPERPVQVTVSDLLGRAFDQHPQGPHDARDRDHVKGDRAQDLTSFAVSHLQ